MRDGRESDSEEYFAYGRPSPSAWIAAGAVAFALFTLGGFIKTYRQLETLREESRREIREFRAALDALRGQESPSRTASPAKRMPLPPAARRDRGPIPPGKSQENAFAPIIPSPERADVSVLESGREYFGGEFVRKAAPVAAAEPRRFSVTSASRKRVMVEGGREDGFMNGSRLEISRGGRWIADVRIIELFDSMAACEILHVAQPPRPGDVARLP
ncbi:MAG: hypothetical protein LBE84_11340 [Planctomycetota bacterium]|jgi:hypothetical protein|nr:hypothetical protein [Planctomycetota bacterium]